MNAVSSDRLFMQRALQLAGLGQGAVEPNPMVGCVLVRDGQIVGEGYHQQYGGPHAEVHALAAAGEAARGATAYVSLEPCCHYGQTPPCTEALRAAGIARVVAAMRDPFPLVDGQGISDLKAAGIDVEFGLCEQEARDLNAPFIKLVTQSCPWFIAKWAMTLDGRVATRAGDSKWISSEASRAIVHQLRGRVDAIMIGRGTAIADDPLLTARPPGARIPLRIVVDTHAQLPLESQLVRTANEFDTLVAVSIEADRAKCRALAEAGCEVFALAAGTPADRLWELVEELAGRQITNVLVEGGPTLLGSMFDAGLIDEVHAFIAPKLVGGLFAKPPIAGAGRALLDEAARLGNVEVQQVGEDVYIRGRTIRPATS
ncbi:MAG: bifunctional diaminohydroxyphosphoribosylaminopyrimidine deaminase/5-amino-6-(5-phosphoribosylamino)uracil reductase RibD [Planctomycetota bacterium]|nr:MAG: bifunctional diaminohydroxyphosphoribosylaminopyrimidine deaminase/5-amino-6-(5-phosphoribosylamino)uracil reductase RibD [Planctomycetota bacterium]